MHGWKAESNATITLDGEWEFYPGVFLMPQEQERRPLSEPAAKVNIPSNWNKWVQPGSQTPYGFGTYRLTIQVDAENEVYSIYVPSVRSSSELYINGKRMASSGRPASTAQAYRAENLPYVATFMANEQRIIELVIQAANYSDPRGGGLVRSLKFGTDEAIYRERQLSMGMQYLTTAALLIQIAYLLIIYAIERKKFWLYFALALLCLTIVMLNSSEDKLMHQWLTIPYAWGYKILCLSFTVLMYSLMHMTSDQLTAAWRTPVVRAYKGLAVVGILAGIALPTRSSETLQYVIFLCAAPIIILLVVSVLRTAMRGMISSLLQLLAFLAFTNHLLWWFIFILTGIKVIFYPFDLMLAMVLSSSIWIRRYYVMYTEQKELTARLEEINRRKDEFLANTSHELRNPLHGMIGMSQVVLEREKEIISDTSMRELETIMDVGRRMSFMLNDLLDTVRLKDNSLRLQIKEVALQPVVSGVMDMIRFMTNGKPIVLKNRVPDRLPNVLADENRLIQILFNLLHNAVKFTHQGEVAVEAHIEKDKMFVAVSDTGVGMDKETQRRVFEPYEQAGAMNGYEGGFGLGLSICRQLVELHGESIEVRSAPGQGSRFIFSLALDPGGEAKGAAVQSQTTQEHTGAVAAMNREYPHSTGLIPYMELAPARAEPVKRYVKDKPRILAVDDDALNLNVLTALLSEEDYEVVAVTDGEEALGLLQDQEWDLLITDLMMPRMSGYELTRLIREQYTMPELPVLVLTARTRPEDIENGFLAGANDYVTKPVEARELRARVQALTQLTSSSRERIRMEAAWLQAQIEPHFFFNTLNSIAALHAVDPEQMLLLIGHFADYLREKFKFQNVGELIPLRDELTLVRSYLFIEQTRFDWLQVQWEIDEGLEVRIPPYSIQPLVENAIRHGLKKVKQDAAIKIKIAKQEDGVEIAVSDNGIGMEEEKAAALLKSGPGQGIGLRNIDLRLNRLYGAGLNIKSAPGAGTTVSFVVFVKL
ncbi:MULTISPECIES: ATP-binding protein [unclassified Paenibacillus]|uniref:hybrid sensor histidine kinase/response regulator n=1 Tax=unclassified Paenibacillus TaxID=185978 RepID=UPI0015A3DA0C|nr:MULTISPECIES: ATP-binding protein [unclassified Paenibacillus]